MNRFRWEKLSFKTSWILRVGVWASVLVSLFFSRWAYGEEKVFSPLGSRSIQARGLGFSDDKEEPSKQDGYLDVLVTFLKSRETKISHSKPKAWLQVKGQSYGVNADGFVSVRLPEGLHTIKIRVGSQTQELPVFVKTQGRTQLIYNHLSNAIDLNEPTQKVQESAKETDVVYGVLSGEVMSITGGPVSGVRVYLKNHTGTAVTDSLGRFRIEAPVGEDIVSLTHPKYSSEILNAQKITRENKAPISVTMTPIGLVLDDYVVLAPRRKGSIQALIEVRRQSAEVADVMSAEQIAKAGDGDAAASLRRVTGLTLVDGKFVYVRGLGERYSSTLFNGVSLPSPDPTRRAVPLDIFPTQILESLVVQKSYSPDRSGEFGGGTVVLNTKALPDRFFFKSNVSQSYHSNAENILRSAEGSRDFLGTDDGTRALPESLRRGNGDPSVFLSRNQHRVKNGGAQTLPELSFAIGNRWKLRPLKLGLSLSTAYSDKAAGFTETRKRFFGGQNKQLVVDSEYERVKVERTRNLGGILTGGVQAYKNQKLTTTYGILRKTTDYVARTEGTNTERNRVRETDREWAERELRTLLVQGEHVIPGLPFLNWKWHFAESKARRYEPDKIVDLYTANDQGDFSFAGLNDGAAYQRRFFDLSDRVKDIGLEVESQFPWFYGRKGKVKIGFSQVQKQRTSEMRRFAPVLDPEVFSKQSAIDGTEDLDTIFSQCYVGDDSCFQMIEIVRATDAYVAQQQMRSYFFKTQWPLLRSLDLSTGMRFERSSQSVESLDPFTQQSVLSFLDTKNWLPGTTLTYRIHPKMQIRGAYSETVSRPDFKELSNTLWRDFELGYEVEGNPSLRSAVLTAYDLRWEWYFAPKENISVGAFYKSFENPVEEIFSPGTDPRITFVNAEGARNAGLELEFSKNLRFLSGALKHWSLSGNYAWIDSQVSLSNIGQADLASPKRPLQGQSKYTANVLLDYSYEPYRLNMSLAYNVYGKRIALLDPNGLPDVIENPFHQLDFVFAKKLGKRMRLGAKIKNILNPSLRFTQGSRTWRELRRGVSVGITLGMSI